MREDYIVQGNEIVATATLPMPIEADEQQADYRFVIHNIGKPICVSSSTGFRLDLGDIDHRAT
jgi:hypothetical protein